MSVYPHRNSLGFCQLIRRKCFRALNPAGNSGKEADEGSGVNWRASDNAKREV
jgi:hypothetical protein